MRKILTAKAAAGTVQAVCSKSFLHRALICAALCEGTTAIRCGEVGEDILATADCLTALGASITHTPEGFTVRGGLHSKTAVLFCRESGSTLRFLLPVAAALGIFTEFVCEKSLLARPLEPLLSALETHGCRFTKTSAGLRCEGQLLPGDYRLDGSISSQYLTGLLLALPLLPGNSRIILTEPLCSAPYVRLTRAVQALFHISTSDDFFIRGKQCYQSIPTLIAEGDWSNAAPFLCAGAFSEEGVTVTGLSADSVQGDRAITELLSRFGAEVCVSDTAVTVRRGALHGIAADASDIPDLVPLLALLGACAEGETVISGAGRLRSKESDRLSATAQVLGSLGACVTVLPDGLKIVGNGHLTGGTVSSFGDHRIAMLAAVASLVCDFPVCIDGAEAVSKSYPSFFEDFLRICR